MGFLIAWLWHGKNLEPHRHHDYVPTFHDRTEARHWLDLLAETSPMAKNFLDAERDKYDCEATTEPEEPP